MAMLRDDLEVALNDLIIALREAADAYETAAEIVEAGDGAAYFGSARDDHRALARRLESEQRSLGHLPKGPDRERELVREAVSRVKAGLLEGEAALLAEREAEEERIAACAAAVLDLDATLSDSLRKVVTDARRHAEDHAVKLAAMAASAVNRG
jgi:hypothetical protein